MLVKPTDDAQQLGELPLGLVRSSIAAALRAFARDDAYARWMLNRETSALATTICQQDVLPTLSVPELESYLPVRRVLGRQPRDTLYTDRRRGANRRSHAV